MGARGIAVLGVPLGGGDTKAPTVILTTAATDPVSAAFSVTATFSEDVTGFAVGDITVTNGAAGSFVAVSASVYTFTVTPNWVGSAECQIGAGVCTDLAGNLNTASNVLTVTIKTNLVVDGTMEATDVTAWTNYGSASAITKQTTSPHGGIRVLRINGDAGDGVNGVTQDVLTPGHNVFLHGFVRSDGTAIPSVAIETSAQLVWTGTTSTAWQEFSGTAIASGNTLILRQASCGLANYCEWDDVYAVDV
jgi:hypothetical protein